MAGRPREFDREAALEAAMLLFWRKGFEAASMHDLCEAMGVRSPSLYAAFESKEALYLAAIEHYVLTYGPPVWDRLGEGATARAGVENLLIGAAEILPKSRSAPAGCMAVLGAVSDEWPASIARAIRRVRLDMLGNLRARLEAGLANGELPAATDIEALSRFYLSVFQGMAIQAKDGATPAELRGAAKAAMVAWPGEGYK
ncbi:AcrR family transcriptional regulator [Bradyrhizobium diazoefficiens]|jgi:AcrR family transcriptional regulator|uniref:TetR family transcriptional regulator n=1 Tax=Bradyrhizobium diazoefficiens TaxID=1355477 RepID=A0A810A7B1_9BRAD|nr:MULTISPECIES: TetR/AcrR family transcriptional regulator [Bradyrhizobium]MBP1063225.1 AcrR family transcriptional regulator [Bradyrhizobium japonicum]AWO93398.1 TetR/AcrR family transcriptional regulator [Bradyrhizobium diazoefficiens]QHP68594.1 TetR/AcrR family transcriptional regulator [Bradyrhizobium sp. LCT2]WLA54748.1 TetR/AcrR family transcriptional regulator [Bradyrhizobium diazoefficiens]BBZ97282.1 TetR family transcriptional regulator [Bradyrhizobium diazoefficiens]